LTFSQREKNIHLETKLQESKLKLAVYFHRIVPFLLILYYFPGSLGCCNSMKIKRKDATVRVFSYLLRLTRDEQTCHCHADRSQIKPYAHGSSSAKMARNTFFSPSHKDMRQLLIFLIKKDTRQIANCEPLSQECQCQSPCPSFPTSSQV
jgi:hypothetical protein